MLHTGHPGLPNGQAMRGFSYEYKRHDATTLFAALEVATGLVRTGHYHRRRRREFLDFMNKDRRPLPRPGTPRHPGQPEHPQAQA